MYYVVEPNGKHSQGFGSYSQAFYWMMMEYDTEQIERLGLQIYYEEY